MLRVRTERLDYDGPLLNWAEPEHPLAFLRGGEGIVGFGERTSFRHEGENRIADLARLALREAAVTEGLAKLGFEPFSLSPAEYARRLAAEREQWVPVVKASGFSSDD